MKLKQIACGDIPKEDRHEFEINMYKTYRAPSLVVGVLIAVFELYMLIVAIMKPGPIYSTINRLVLFNCYCSLFVVTLALVVTIQLNDKQIKQKPSIYLRICFLYAIFICMWSAFLSGYSHRNVGTIDVFLYVCLSVAILLPIKPWASIVIYSLAWITFYFVMQYFINPTIDPFSSVLNSAFASMLSIVLSIIMYHNRVSNFLNRKTIMEKNRQIQEMNDRLRTIVLTDELTQINNRRYLEKNLPLVLNQARGQELSVALYMIDIDSFKDYNSRYGHQQGDECLRQVADATKEAIAGTQSHLLRYGGEEFLVFSIDINMDDALTLGEAIRRNVEQKAIAHSDRPEGVVTVSVGVTVSAGDSVESLSKLINYADCALYIAKSGNKNRVEYCDARTIQ